MSPAAYAHLPSTYAKLALQPKVDLSDTVAKLALQPKVDLSDTVAKLGLQPKVGLSDTVAKLAASAIKELRPDYAAMVSRSLTGLRPTPADIAGLWRAAASPDGGSFEPISPSEHFRWLSYLSDPALLNLYSIYLGLLLALSFSIEAWGGDVPDRIQTTVGSLSAGLACVAVILRRREGD